MSKIYITRKDVDYMARMAQKQVTEGFLTERNMSASHITAFAWFSALTRWLEHRGVEAPYKLDLRGKSTTFEEV